MKQVTNNSMLKNTLLNTGKSFFHGDEGAYIYLSGFDMFCVFILFSRLNVSRFFFRTRRILSVIIDDWARQLAPDKAI